MQIGMEPVVIDWTKEEPKMAQNNSRYLFIANNSIFKPIVQYFFSQIIAVKECYLMINSEKKSFYRFQNIPKNANLVVKPL